MTSQLAREARKRNRVFSLRRLKMDYPLYLMLALPVILLFIYSYIPMGGLVISYIMGFIITWFGIKEKDVANA